VHAGQYAVVARSTSAGYREFKTSDGHRDDVQAVVIRHFGAVQPHDKAERADDLLLETALSEPGKTQEYATFWLDGQLMALHARHVLEAVSASDMRRMALGRSAACIGMVSRQAAGESGYVWVHDLAQLLGRAPAHGDGQVLVLRVGTHTCGLLVDELHAVAEVEDRTVVPNPLGDTHWVSHIIRANQGRVAIQLLDGERLVAFVRRQGAAAA
jgi:chemotaxis signal transduction protein